MNEEKQKFALFIDADNAPVSKLENVLSEVTKYGVPYGSKCSVPSLCNNMDFKTLPDKIIKQIEKFETPFFLFDLDKIGVKINAPNAKTNGLRLYGLTFHVGSQCYSPSNWHAGIAQCAVLFKQFQKLEMINIRGEFPVQDTTSASEIAQIIRVINKSINTCFERRPLLFVEPGRFIVGDSALACTSVINVNHQNSISRAAVDLSVFGGLLEIIESSDDFYYPVEASGNGNLWPYRIIGSTCAGTDIIAEEIMLPQLAVDQRILKQSSRIYLSNTGAYTLDYVMNSGMHGFNGLNIPQVYYIKNDKILERK